jgi:hypothetical protein
LVVGLGVFVVGSHGPEYVHDVDGFERRLIAQSSDDFEALTGNVDDQKVPVVEPDRQITRLFDGKL